MHKHTARLDTKTAEKLLRAMTSGTDELFQIILDPNLEILSAALKNPALCEEHLLSLLKRKDLTGSITDKVFNRVKKSPGHKLTLALVKNPATSDNIYRMLLPQLHLFELADLCFLPGTIADRRLAAERIILQRLPVTPLGSKISLARRAPASVVTALFKEGQPQLVEACLNSPRLKEGPIYQFLTGSKATAETISLIARHNRWNQRPNLRIAILKNPQTPRVWLTLWLPKLSHPLLKQVAAGNRLPSAHKLLISSELKRRLD